MNRPPLIVVFGAAVRPDGRPSDALLRRARHGLSAAARFAEAPILCSGGNRRAGNSEAELIAGLLREGGASPHRLVLDLDSIDTLDNVAAAVRQARAGDHRRVVICSDGYHVPRIRLLLALSGVPSDRWPARPLGGERAPLAHALTMGVREAFAIAYSVMRLAGRRLRRLS